MASAPEQNFQKHNPTWSASDGRLLTPNNVYAGHTCEQLSGLTTTGAARPAWARLWGKEDNIILAWKRGREIEGRKSIVRYTHGTINQTLLNDLSSLCLHPSLHKTTSFFSLPSSLPAIVSYKPCPGLVAPMVARPADCAHKPAAQATTAPQLLFQKSAAHIIT